MFARLSAAVDDYFELSERNSTLSRELLAGLSTYLSLAYIFVVNPAILSDAGMDVSAVFFATVVASAFSTFLMGFWARLPFALAPGLEMNGFFAYVVVRVLGFSWQAALAAVFLSGALCVLFTWLPIRKNIIDGIPNGLKTNIAVSVGFFVLAIGFHLSGLIHFENGIPESFGSLLSVKAFALYLGLAISVVLGWKRLQFPGGMLIAVIVAAVYCHANGIYAGEAAELSSDMLSAVNQLEWSAFLHAQLWPAMLVLFLIDYFGSIGKFIGLTRSTQEVLSATGDVKRLREAMYVDGIGTMGGALLGTSSIITYVESAVGIAAGGRTGIAAIVCGTLMLASIFVTGLVGLVPVEATAGVLCYVAWLLIPRKEIWHLLRPRTPLSSAPVEYVEFEERFEGRYHAFDLIVGVLMALVSLFMFSLSNAMLLGFLCYAAHQLLRRCYHREPVNIYLIVATTILLLSVALQYVLA